jgi:membrane-associated phospholipid phosphatase
VLHALNAPLVQRRGALCLATALVPAVGLSRVYLGVHFPSDVLGGQLVAALWIGGAQRLLLHRATR